MRYPALTVLMLWAACASAERSVVDLDFNELFRATKAEEQLAAKRYEQACAAYTAVFETAQDPLMVSLAEARAAVALGLQENKYEEGLARARAVADRPCSVQAQIQLMAGHKKCQALLDAFGEEDIAAWPRRALPQLPQVGRQDLRALAFFDRGRAFLETGNAEAGVRDIERACDFAVAGRHKLELLTFLARDVFERMLKDADRTFETDMRIVELDAGFAATMRATISAAGYLRDQERYDAALEVLDRSQWRHQTSRYWFTRGMQAVAGTLGAAGRFREAADAYRVMVEADEQRISSADRSWAALQRGRMLATAGDAEVARKVYATLLERQDVGDEHRRQAETALADLTPSAEEAGWEHVFTDRFDREGLGEQWEVLEGAWTIEDGALQGRGMLITTRSFPARDETKLVYPGGFAIGYIRMEFDITLLAQPPEDSGSDTAEDQAADSGCFLNVHWPGQRDEAKLECGYAFFLGELYGSRYRVTRPVHRAVIAEAEPGGAVATPGQRHAIIAENDEGVVRLLVDGKPILEKEELFSVMGSGFDKVGFQFAHPFRVDNLTVYVKALPGGLDRDEQRTK